MLDEIKNIIPKMEKSDSVIIYNNIVNKYNKISKKKKLNLYIKYFVPIATCIVLIAIFVPIGMLYFGNSVNHDKELGYPNADINDNSDAVYGYTLSNGTTISIEDCYHDADSDVLTIYIRNSNLNELYIKEYDSNNKIIDVKLRSTHESSSFYPSHSAYTVNIKNKRDVYVDIRFVNGTFEKNLLSSSAVYDIETNSSTDIPSDDDISANDTKHAHKTLNLTTIKFLCSAIDPSGGYEEISYTTNYDNLSTEPKVFISGLEKTLEEAMNIVEFPVLIEITDLETNVITYNKNNRETEIYYSYNYGFDSRISIRAIIPNKNYDLKSFAEKYIDTNLYVYDNTNISEVVLLEGDFYYCYKNDENMTLAYFIVSKQWQTTTCFYIMYFEMFGIDANCQLRDIVKSVNVIYN